MRILCALLLLSFSVSVAQTSGSSQSSDIPKEIPSFDLTAIDKTVDPCVDFYQYSCGNWMKNNPIPPDKSAGAATTDCVSAISTCCATSWSRPRLPASAPQSRTKVGDYYAACMDETVIEKRGTEPLAPTMKAIAALNSKQQLIPQVSAMQSDGIRVLFSFGQMPDMHDSRQTIANLDQGGLTLPDRDYYIKDDAKSVETRQKYLDHVQKMFELAGDKPDVAAAEAKTVLAIETALAKASMDRTVRRDPHTRDHLMAVTEIAASAPNFQLTEFFADSGTPKFTSLNVSNPDFFKAVNDQISRNFP